MSMTKKDYELIARAIYKTQSLGDNHLYVVDMIADELQRANPKFNRTRFMQACGIGA